MNKSLLDTDIFSEIAKGRHHKVRSKSRSYLLQFRKYTISVLTVMETVKGLQKKGKIGKVTQFLTMVKSEEIEVLPITLDAAALAGRIIGDLERQGTPVGIADSMIAAIAIEHNLTLVSGNIRHYDRIQKLGYALELKNWKN